ncbi:MAG: hypothetical protein A2068_12660 [Ignavibacteria bacterium GWB2_35_6b]|nr:MAG: hypothetical protein A2068_12660 [Ignavibacteria bacterium GWB2_35_6b]
MRLLLSKIFITILFFLNVLKAQVDENILDPILCNQCTTLYQISRQSLTSSDYSTFQNIESYTVDTLAAGIYATDYALFIDDNKSPIEIFTNGNNLYYSNITGVLYKYYKDDYDFVMVMPGETIFGNNGKERTPGFIPLQTSTEGIGQRIFNESSIYGSKGRLLGIIYHSFGSPAILAHELGHNWSAFLKNLSTDGHWDPLTNIGGIMVTLPQVLEYSENSFRSINSFAMMEPQGVFSNLDLYLMGLLNLEEVPVIKKLIGVNNTNSGNIKYKSIEVTYPQDLPKIFGIRNPSYINSPKVFTLAYIVVKKGSFSQDEFDYHSQWSKFSSGSGSYDFGANNTFEKATFGKAKLETKLKHNIAAYSYSKNFKPDISLSQNYPNPFNPVTYINFSIPESMKISIKVYDILGKFVTTLIDQEKQAGNYRIYFDGSKFSSGVYIYKMETRDFTDIKKFILLK